MNPRLLILILIIQLTVLATAVGLTVNYRLDPALHKKSLKTARAR